MAGHSVMTIVADNTALLEACARASELADAFPEFRERLRSLVESGAELAAVDGNRRPTDPADKLIVRLEPSEAFRRLLAAGGAGDV